MTTITWNHSCYFCNRPITGVMPVILFAIDKPLFVGLAHDTCYGDKLNFGRYRVKSPNHLSSEQVAFLAQFYPMLFALPDAFTPNVALRLWLVDFIHRYPMSDPMVRLRDHKKMHPDKPMDYEGDLEADYISFLAKVQKAAKENPVDVEFDFP
jgi:hypothetical protein